MATPKSDSTTKVTQHSLPASIKPSNPEAFPTVYADNAWDVIGENSDAAALLGAPGQYTQHDINGEALSRYGRVFPTVGEMVAVAAPDGYVAYCTATGLHYDYKASRTAHPTLGKWRVTDAVTYYEHDWNIMGATDPEGRRHIMQTTERIYIARLCPSEPLTLTNTGNSVGGWYIQAIHFMYYEQRGQRWEYSADGGVTWTPVDEQVANAISALNILPGQSVQIRAITSVPTLYTSATERFQIVLSGTISVSGNVMSLLWHDYEDKFFIDEPWALAFLFYGQTALADASQLGLPAVTLSEGCYRSMFEGCTHLVASPVLPAPTIPASAYRSMFEGCEQLTTLGTIGALAAPGESAMEEMFAGCEALANAQLYLTQVTGAHALDAMFTGCEALAEIQMPLLTRVTGPLAMYMMFADCGALEAITVGWTTWPTTLNSEELPTLDWVATVAADGTFTAPTLYSTQDDSHVPQGWTAQTND